jgi:cytochrome c
MKRIFALIIAFVVSSAAFHSLRADDAQARMEAMILVKKAVAFLKENGKNRTLQEFSNLRSRFVVREHHIFVCKPDGKCVASPADQNMAGRMLVDIARRPSRDSLQEQDQEASRKEAGWQYCVFADPAGNKTETRFAYLEKVDDLIIGCSLSW